MWKYETPRLILLMLIGAVGLFNGSMAGLFFCAVFVLIVVVLFVKAVIGSFIKT